MFISETIFPRDMSWGAIIGFKQSTQLLSRFGPIHDLLPGDGSRIPRGF